MLQGPNLDEYFSHVEGSGTTAMIPDLLGSTVGLVNSAGAIATGYQYSPFGQTTTSGASSTNPIQYTGREMDPTGLYFMRARYYNPIAQRFISQDPIGLSGGQPNLYAYVFNQPTNWTDPLGLLGGSVGADNTAGVDDCAGAGCPHVVPAVGQTPTSGYLQLAILVRTPSPSPTLSETPIPMSEIYFLQDMYGPDQAMQMIEQGVPLPTPLAIPTPSAPIPTPIGPASPNSFRG
jgi:RHS repeat-associated protein